MSFQEYLGEKTQKFSPAVLFFLVFDEMFIEVPLFHETSPALKNVWLHAWVRNVSLSENFANVLNE